MDTKLLPYGILNKEMYQMKIGPHGQLCLSSGLPFVKYSSMKDNNVYVSGVYNVQPASSHNVIFSVYNRTDTKYIMFDTFRIGIVSTSTSDASNFILRVGATGTPVGGTSVSSINAYTALADNSELSFEYGTSITGLSTPSVYIQDLVQGATAVQHIDLTGIAPIFLPPRKYLTFSADNAGVGYSCWYTGIAVHPDSVVGSD